MIFLSDYYAKNWSFHYFWGSKIHILFIKYLGSRIYFHIVEALDTFFASRKLSLCRYLVNTTWTRVFFGSVITFHRCSARSSTTVMRFPYNQTHLTLWSTYFSLWYQRDLFWQLSYSNLLFQKQFLSTLKIFLLYNSEF